MNSPKLWYFGDLQTAEFFHLWTSQPPWGCVLGDVCLIKSVSACFRSTFGRWFWPIGYEKPGVSGWVPVTPQITPFLLVWILSLMVWVILGWRTECLELWQPLCDHDGQTWDRSKYHVPRWKDSETRTLDAFFTPGNELPPDFMWGSTLSSSRGTCGYWRWMENLHQQKKACCEARCGARL